MEDITWRGCPAEYRFHGFDHTLNSQDFRTPVIQLSQAARTPTPQTHDGATHVTPQTDEIHIGEQVHPEMQNQIDNLRAVNQNVGHNLD